MTAPLRFLIDLADWRFVAALAGLVLLDGLRRLPAGTLVLRKSPGQPWTVVPVPHRRFTLVSWPAPFALTLVLVPQTDDGTAGAGTSVAALRSVWLRAVRLLAVATLVVLVLGMPALSRWFGTAGFLLGVAVVFVLSASAALTAGAATRRLGGDRARSSWWALELANPFATSRAWDACAERLLGECSAIATAQALLPADGFAGWVRPRAYDRLRPGAPPDAELDAWLTPEQLEEIVRSPPVQEDPSAHAFCPRCGALYQDDGAPCGNCGVGLVNAPPP